jgi:hypothetical protein
MTLVVERVKKVWDFSLTMYFWHTVTIVIFSVRGQACAPFWRYCAQYGLF